MAQVGQVKFHSYSEQRWWWPTMHDAPQRLQVIVIQSRTNSVLKLSSMRFSPSSPLSLERLCLDDVQWISRFQVQYDYALTETSCPTWGLTFESGSERIHTFMFFSQRKRRFAQIVLRIAVNRNQYLTRALRNGGCLPQKPRSFRIRYIQLLNPSHRSCANG